MDFIIVESPPEPHDYVALRQKTRLSPKSIQAAQKGLPNSLYALQILSNGTLVGMGRVIGDGGCFFEIVDIAVSPEYQGQGLGKIIMEHIDRYLAQAAYEGSYVSMVADQPAFYKKFGYKPVAPKSQGMYKRLSPKTET